MNNKKLAFCVYKCDESLTGARLKIVRGKEKEKKKKLLDSHNMPTPITSTRLSKKCSGYVALQYGPLKKKIYP